MLIIDMPKKYLTDASGFVSCAMCQKYLPLLYRDCNNDFKGCLIKGELPYEHGDLIDRDALIEDINKQVRMLDAFGIEELRLIGKEMQKGMIAEIDKQPVVIAAERKDDE